MAFSLWLAVLLEGVAIDFGSVLADRIESSTGVSSLLWEKVKIKDKYG